MGTLRGWGSGLVGRNLLKALVELPGDQEFVFWVPEEWQLDRAALPKHVRLRNTQGGTINKLLLENVEIRRALRRDRLDCLFSTGDTSLVGCRRPHLLLVQQAYLAYPADRWDFPMTPAFRSKMMLMGAYLRATLPTVSRVAVQSQHMKEAFASRWSFPKTRIDVVPSAIPQGLYAVDDPASKEANRQPYLAYIASGDPHKNHRVLLPMLKILVSRGYDIRCKFSLNAEQGPEMVAEVRRLGLEDRVDFRGQLSAKQAAELTRRAAVVVIPSMLESFGIIYYEAMAAGRPVVAADTPWSREALADTALYAEGHDAEGWAERVGTLLDDRDLATALGSEARQRFQRSHLPWTKIAAAYLDILGDLR